MITTRETVARVSPMRFTRHAPEITELYEAVGLRRTLSRNGFAVLAGRTGVAVVHPLQTAEFVTEPTTSFQLDVPDTAEAVERLEQHGVEARWWDESWGRLGEVASGLGLFSLGTQDDDYGYDEHTTTTPSEVDVVQVVGTADPDAARQLFGLFGFVPDESGRRLHSATSGGVILLEDGDAAHAGDWLSARIALETSEPLEKLTARLERLGHEVDSADGSVTIRDAEGAPVRVTPAV